MATNGKVGVRHILDVEQQDWILREDVARGYKSINGDKGSPPLRKVQFFLTLFKRPLTPPPFYLNICPILQGVFFKRVFEH